MISETKTRTRHGGLKIALVDCEAIVTVKARKPRRPRKRRETRKQMIQRWATMLWQEAPELIYWEQFKCDPESQPAVPPADDLTLTLLRKLAGSVGPA